MKPLSEGRPKDPCINAVWDDVRHLLDMLGIPPIISAVFLLIGILLSIPLYWWDEE